MAFCWIQPTSQKRQIVCRWYINERSLSLWPCQQYWSCGNLPFGRSSTGNARFACCSTKLEGQSFSYLLSNSSNVFTNFFHEFFPRMFLRLSILFSSSTPNFTNPEYFVCLLFEYFFQIKVLSWYQNIPKNANKTRHIKKKKPLNNTLNGEIEIRVFDGLNEIGQRVLKI